jgi:[protein-PII] uridylyltransferase
VRSVKDALLAAGERTETLTALVDARAVAGDTALVDDLLTGLGSAIRRGRLPYLGALVAAERARREHEPFQLLDVNLKEGRGGLRTLQALHWQRRGAALGGAVSEPPSPVERDALATLLAARNGLHAAAGRAHEVYAFELRPRVAAWLGGAADEISRRLYVAMRSVDARAASQWELPWPAVSGVTGTDAAGRPPRRRWAMPWRAPAPASPPPAVAPRSIPSSPLALAARALDRSDATVFTAVEAGVIRGAGGPSWDSADRAALLRLLAAGPRGWQVFEALDQLGWVGRALPEWRHTVAAPQHVPFHLHPLDTHLWRTVLEVQAISAAGSDEPWCHDVASELGSLDDALLAALLHDIGKGWEGDHAVTGAAAAGAFLRRARFGPALTGTVSAAVRYHLLLPNVATRRDLDDPRVIARVADQAGDLRTLRILYLLSVADSRATGPSIWNPWKASLVRTLFARTADELARRASAEPHTPVEETIINELVARAAGRFSADAVREHVHAMPLGYVLALDVTELLRHLEAGDRFTPGTVVVDVRPGAPAANALVVTEDRPGLLAAISGVFALHNISVLDGRFYTRSDGVVFDSFHVADVRGSDLDEQRWTRVRRDLARVVADDLPLEEMLREKAHAYRHVAGAAVPVRVLADTAASESFTVVEIHCTDRAGMLHDIARALFEQGLDIRVAKIDTQGREVVDTFYVRDLAGEPLTDAVRLASVIEGVRKRLEG